MAAATMELEGEVEALGPQTGDELVHPVFGRGDIRRNRDAGDWREGDDPIDRRATAAEELSLPCRAQQNELGLRVCRPERVDGREREHQIAEPPGTQHGDLAHPWDEGAAVPERRR